MKLFHKCKNCGKGIYNIMNKGFKIDNNYYCSHFCLTYTEKHEFCDECLSETTSEPFKGAYLYNFMGTTLLGNKNRCPKCHSIIQTKWLFFLIPIYPVAKYRMIYLEPTFTGESMIGRKIKNNSTKLLDKPK